MAITNAQQFKQLVNPPMEGKKRPGYRGEAAAASDKAAGRSAGRDTSVAGTSNVATLLVPATLVSLPALLPAALSEAAAASPRYPGLFLPSIGGFTSCLNCCAFVMAIYLFYFVSPNKSRLGMITLTSFLMSDSSIP